ncbi:MAG: hypothetical protein HYX48_06405 [Chlamydiales bacterium]|nr:hypothetical protein [Chlamydiales bacterium]
MSNQDKDSKLFVGLLVGGVIGIGALSIFLATRRSGGSSLNTVGEAIARVGEILDSHGINEPDSLKSVEKKIHRHESSVSEVLEWVATGLHLWKKFNN